jgi:hypothetical protein
MSALKSRTDPSYRMQKLRKEARAGRETYRQRVLARERGELEPLVVTRGCENASSSYGFRVAGDWEDMEESGNCGECDWCEEHDD